jgi:polyhydroxybutyrate depolymerase
MLPRTASVLAALAVLVLMVLQGCGAPVQAQEENRPLRDAIRGMLGRDGGDSLSAGVLTQVPLTHQGVARSYFVHVPAALEGRVGVPAVMLFHGGEGDGRDAEEAAGLAAVAQARGFVAIYPNSPGQQWNDGRATTNSGFDDVAFVRAVVADASARFGVDRGRVFAAGMSNGGMFVQRLACDAPDLIRAGAAVVANMPADLVPRCAPTRAVPLLLMGGTADPLMPFGGGEIAAARRLGAGVGGQVISWPQTVDFWARANGCDSRSGPEQLADAARDGTRVAREALGGCSAPVVAFTVDGGGHTWPGMEGRERRLTGPISRDIDATGTIIGFFAGFGL